MKLRNQLAAFSNPIGIKNKGKYKGLWFKVPVKHRNWRGAATEGMRGGALLLLFTPPTRSRSLPSTWWAPLIRHAAARRHNAHEHKNCVVHLESMDGRGDGAGSLELGGVARDRAVLHGHPGGGRGSRTAMPSRTRNQRWAWGTRRRSGEAAASRAQLDPLGRPVPSVSVKEKRHEQGQKGNKRVQNSPDGILAGGSHFIMAC